MSKEKLHNKSIAQDFNAKNTSHPELNDAQQYATKITVPLNIKCNNCHCDSIIEGQKYYAKKELVQFKEYSNLKLLRFHIKCPNCFTEITFKTNYELETEQIENVETSRHITSKPEKESREKLNQKKILVKRGENSRHGIEEFKNMQEAPVNLSTRKKNFDTKKSRKIEEENKKISELIRKNKEDEEYDDALTKMLKAEIKSLEMEISGKSTHKHSTKESIFSNRSSNIAKEHSKKRNLPAGTVEIVKRRLVFK